MIDQEISQVDLVVGTNHSISVSGAQFNSAKANYQFIAAAGDAFNFQLQAAAVRGDDDMGVRGGLAWAVIGTFTEADTATLGVVDVVPQTQYRFIHISGEPVRVILSG